MYTLKDENGELGVANGGRGRGVSTLNTDLELAVELTGGSPYFTPEDLIWISFVVKCAKYPLL